MKIEEKKFRVGREQLPEKGKITESGQKEIRVKGQGK